MRPNNLLSTPKAFLAAFLGFFVGGCAVLTVDVDVYKGALVNSPKIQSEQLASMAMAARPLLLTLSNNLAPPIPVGQKEVTDQDSIWALQIITSLIRLYDDKTNRPPGVLDEANRAKSAYSNLTNLFGPGTQNQTFSADHIPDIPALSNNLTEYRLTTERLIQETMPFVSDSNRTALNRAKEKFNNQRISRSDFAAIQGAVNSVLDNGFPGSLDVGRPNKGLGTVITDFLNYSATNSNDKQQMRAMTMGVVDFAEKIKFIADNQAFMEKASTNNSFKQDALTLQAIGNAMLSLADTIARREGFEETFANSYNANFSNSLKNVEWIGFRTANSYLESAGNQSATNKSTQSTNATATITIDGNPASSSFVNGDISATINKADASIVITNAKASVIITSPDATAKITNADVSITTSGHGPKITIANASASITTTEKNKTPLIATITNAAATINFNTDSVSTTTTSTSTTITLKNTTATISITSAAGPNGKSLAKSSAPSEKTNDLASKQDTPLPLPEMATNSGKIDIRAAQEMLIQSLRDIQVTATLNGDKTRATNAQDALDLAMAYRAENIEILPAMNYLRNSYPATSLQQGDDGLWHNMLAQQGLRSQAWPFDEYPFGEYFHPWIRKRGSIRKDADTQADIDKQFWQNINRVRVAGSGLTSYVITKDDIGNWYVKSYTANPSNIIEGAQSLMPAPAAAKALGKAASAAVTSTTTTQTNAAPTTTLTKEYGQIYNQYTNTTVNQAIDLTNFVSGLNPTNFNATNQTRTYTNVTTFYTNNFTSYLAADLKTLADSVAKPTNFTSIANAQVDLLYQLKRFSAAEASRDTLTTNSYGFYATNTVLTKLKKYAENRLDTLKTFSTQLGVLSKAE
jgi:hypothetical protein